jgi:hypothetical protein
VSTVDRLDIQEGEDRVSTGWTRFGQAEYHGDKWTCQAYM